MLTAKCKNVEFSLCLINYALHHEDTLESGGTAPPFLTLALEGDDWSNSYPAHFTPEEIAPSTHWIGGWLSFRGGLDIVETVTVGSIK
jgi:hypothetical protein